MSAVAAAGRRRRPVFGWRRTAWGEYLAEALGTFVLICFGDGVVAMAVAALNQSGRGTAIFDASGDWLIIGWGWGFAVTFGVYIAGAAAGRGLSQLALQFAIAWCRIAGHGELMLTVHQDHAAAIHVYEKYGFVFSGQLSSRGHRIYRKPL